jgi:hypothetical protein
MRTLSEQILVTRTSLCLQTSFGFVGHHQCKTTFSPSPQAAPGPRTTSSTVAQVGRTSSATWHVTSLNFAAHERDDALLCAHHPQTHLRLVRKQHLGHVDPPASPDLTCTFSAGSTSATYTYRLGHALEPPSRHTLPACPNLTCAFSAGSTSANTASTCSCLATA